MKRSVLVVEDEAFVGLEAVFIAESLGFEVTGPFASSSAALEAAAYLPPDIALIDVNLLDGPTGPDLAAILNGTYGTIAIMVTANPEAVSVGECGVSAVITKPFTSTDVGFALGSAVELLPDTDSDTASRSKATDAIGSEAA